MSRKELPRAGLVKAALSGRITNRHAAGALHLTVRQVQRLKRRFADGGAPALRQREVFGGRGDDGLIQRFQLAVWPDGAGRCATARRR